MKYIKCCKNKNCNKEFETNRKNVQYCSHKCSSSCPEMIAKRNASAKKTFYIKYDGKHPMQTEATQQKRKDIALENHGVEHYSKTDEYKQKVKQTKLELYGDKNYNNPEKRKQTNLERFGVENPQQVKEIREKAYNTKVAKYGEGNSSNSKKAVQTSKERWGDNFNNRTKAKETLLKNYGVETPIESPEILAKIKKTNLEKFGVEYPLQSKNIYDKTKESKIENHGSLSYNNHEQTVATNIEKFGVDNPFKSEIIKEKIKQTNIDRYGFEYPVQNIEIFCKQFLSRYGITYQQYISLLPARKMYYRKVWNITEKQTLTLLENHDRRGTAGKEGAYQLDHIYPISKGFENNIAPEKIGDISNLRFIPWQENLSKGNKILEIV